MNTPLEEIFFAASRLGVNIRLVGGSFLEICPPDRVTLDFLALVREHKAELLAWLTARAARRHVIRQVLQGDFDGADTPTVNRVAAELQALTPCAARNLALVRLGQEATP